MRRYHINPKTGMPSVCHAKKGNCPYGGKSGEEGHYISYSMALAESQKAFEKEHRLLPKGPTSSEIKQYENMTSILEFLPEDNIELKEEIRNTTNVDLLMGIIEGKFYVEDGWDKIGVALQNPNLPRDFIDDVLYNNPELYNIETRRRIMLNTSLTHEDIMYVVENESDLYMRSVALKNPGIDPSYVDDFLENRKEDLTELPWYMMTENRAIDDDKIDNWYEWIADENIDIEIDEIGEITKDYSDWMVTYERNQRFNPGH